MDVLTRTCRGCGKDKPLAELRKNKQCTYGRDRWCMSCDTPDQRKRFLVKQYNITLERYDEILATQNGTCALCDLTHDGFGRFLHVDHDHATRRVRGLLCFDHNVGIGKLGDNAEGLRRALAYLEGSHPTASVVCQDNT